MLGLNVSVQSGVGEIALSAATHEVTAFLILPRPPGGHFVELTITLLLHYMKSQ